MSNTEKERREKQSNEATKQTFRAKQAAEYLSIGLSTFWLFVKQGKFTPIHLSERVTIFERQDLDRFIESKKNVQ